MSREKNSEDTNKKNIKRYLCIIIMEVLALGLALIILGEYKLSSDSAKISNKKNSEKAVETCVESLEIEKDENAVEENGLKVVTPESTDSKEAKDREENTEEKNIEKKDDITQKNLTKEEKEQLDKVNEIIKNMTLEEKICQMFIVSPEELTNYNNVTAAGENTKKAIEKYHVAGVVYFSGNIKSEEQLTKLLANTQQYATENNGIPMFLGIDEEGGDVARLANNSQFNVTKFNKLSTVSSKEEAYKIGSTIGKYLSRYGFNLDFAPDADVLTNKKNTVVKNRSFGTSSKKVTQYSKVYAQGLNDNGVCATYKHFPGHGATAGDSHEGYAYTNKAYEQLEKTDLVPFIDGIKEGIDLIMVGHISVPKVIGDDTPSSLSKIMVTDILREKLGYEGVVITDAMNMGAISKNYTVEESATEAIKAGCDIILMPADFRKAYNSLLKSVKSGDITEERIEESVRRVLLLKQKRLNW
ncbi:glycoside hydrolase family 3 protein [Anaerosporobacter sp.]|uniref:glycoside hydrolase family 3 protein n=1 Tax=Anaerosporobacter sp. TaxID=1872529 RepID=UPI00286F4614|nr:glycoside hydrolase family 3 protein [Anaerosporobacter sp.]